MPQKGAGKKKYGFQPGNTEGTKRFKRDLDIQVDVLKKNYTRLPENLYELVNVQDKVREDSVI